MVYPQHWLSACVLALLTGFTAVIPSLTVFCLAFSSFVFLSASSLNVSHLFCNTLSWLQGRKHTLTAPQVTYWKYTPLFSRNPVPRKPLLNILFCYMFKQLYSILINNPLERCVFESTVIGLGYINLRHSVFLLCCFRSWHYGSVVLPWQKKKQKTNKNGSVSCNNVKSFLL